MNPPPFLISFQNKDAFKAALEPDVLSAYGDEIDRLIDLKLPPAVSVRVLSSLFGFSAGFVGALRQNPERYYRRFTIPKGNKTREIHAPKVGLKIIQKWLGHHLAAVLEFDSAVYGFVAGKSAPMAAAIHCESTWVFSVDIANFFPTTSKAKVEAALRGIGYSGHSAALIAQLCCYGGNLVQGSPASPLLSNLVFRPYDSLLKSISREAGSNYTRYADDIVFSGVGDPPEWLMDKIRAVISEAGWKIAEGKDRLAKLPGRLKVHGLVVHGKTPRLTKGYRNRIRAFEYLLSKGKISETDVAKIRGHLSYAKSVQAISPHS